MHLYYLFQHTGIPLLMWGHIKKTAESENRINQGYLIEPNRLENQKLFKPTMVDIGEILITHRHPSSYDSSHLLESILISYHFCQLI
mgnify:CR=1 FL=1